MIRVKIEEVKQSEQVFRFFFPEIPDGNKAKSFRAFWREDKNNSASFFKSESGEWVLNDFAQSKGFDIIKALIEFKSLSFKNICEIVSSQFPEFTIESEKTPQEWASRRNIPVGSLNIKNNSIVYKYSNWQNGNYVGSKIRRIGENLTKEERFVCKDGLSLKKHFYHVNLGQSKRLYVLGGEGDCIAFSQKVSSPCVGVSGEADRLPLELIKCIDFYKFEEIYIIYDNPLYEDNATNKARELAKELISLNSINLVQCFDWKGIFSKDIAEYRGDLQFKILEFKPIDEDKELILEGLKEREEKTQLELLNYLPENLANYLNSLAESIDPFFPREAILTFFLSVISGLPGINKVIKFNGSSKHSVLWSIVALPVGSGKSPILNHLIAPLLELEIRYFKTYIDEMKAYDETMQEIKVRRKNKETNLQTPELPVHEHILLSNTTIEALRRAYLNNEDGLLVSCDEIASFFNSHNQYKGGSGDDRQSYLSFASGEGLNITRVEETNNIRTLKTAVSLTGGTQPNILKDLYNADKLKADGLWDRFLYYYNPDYKMCEDFCNSPKPSLNELRKLYNDYLRNRDLEQVYQFRNNNIPQKVSIEFKKKINSSDERFKGYYSKQWNQYLQLCLILQILNNPNSPLIEDDIAIKANQLIDFYCLQAEKMLNDFTDNKKQEINQYSKILELKEITARAIIQRNWSQNKQEAIKILKEMEILGLGEMFTSPRGAVSFIKN